MEITKSQLIGLWSLYCDEKANDPDMFSSVFSTESPSYTLRINDKISLIIDAFLKDKLYYIRLVFSDIISYKRFDLEEIEFESLETSWETGNSKAIQIEKNKKISEGLVEFENLLNQFQSV